MSGSDFDTDNPEHWRQLAAHEAGHAVVALAEQIPFSRVTIADPLDSYIRSRRPRTREEHESEVLMLLAGAVAEDLIGFSHGETGRGVDDDDARASLRAMGLDGSDLEPYREQAREILTVCRPELNALVVALVERRTLTDAECAEIVGRID